MQEHYGYQKPRPPIRRYRADDEIICEKEYDQDHLHAELDHGFKHVRDGHSKAWKIDLTENVRVGGKDVGIFGKSGREKDPDRVGAEIEEHLRNTVGGDAGNASENEGVDQAADQGIEKDPRRTENRLLIRNDKGPLREKQYQIAVFPDLAQVQIKYAMLGRYVCVVLT